MLSGRAFLRAFPAALLIAACSSDKVTGPTTKPIVHDISVALTSETSHFIYPGDEIALRVAVDLTAGDSASRVTLYAAGLFTDSLDLPVPVHGDFSYIVRLTLNRGPIPLGPLFFTAVARLGNNADTARIDFNVSEDGAPTLNVTILNEPQPGDSAYVLVNAKDRSGIATISFQASGVGAGSIQTLQYAYPGEQAVAFKYFIPPDAAIGATLNLTIKTLDAFNNLTTATLQRPVGDFKPPTVTLTSITPGRRAALVPNMRPYADFVGDTIGLNVVVHDNRKLGWLGYRLGSEFFGYVVRDSMAITDTVQVITLRMPVTAAMDGRSRQVTVFVRDSVGNVADAGFSRDFIDGTLRNFSDIAGLPDPVNDAAYSAAAGRAAVLSNGVVTVLSVDPLLKVGAVATPASGYSIDVLPGSDTAWAATRIGGIRRLYAVPLGAATPAVARSIDVPMTEQPSRMRLTTRGQALVTAAPPVQGSPSNVRFVDLATGVTSTRQATMFATVESSLDHTLLLGNDPIEIQMRTYDVATDSFGTPRPTPFCPPTVSQDGTWLLSCNKLYDRALTLVRTVADNTYHDVAGFLSADGQYAYYIRWPGIHKVRISDGVTVEKIFSIDPDPVRLIELPALNKMLVIGLSRFAVIDLSAGAIVP